MLLVGGVHEITALAAKTETGEAAIALSAIDASVQSHCRDLAAMFPLELEPVFPLALAQKLIPGHGLIVITTFAGHGAGLHATVIVGGEPGLPGGATRETVTVVAGDAADCPPALIAL